jgi:hypothetical protein
VRKIVQLVLLLIAASASLFGQDLGSLAVTGWRPPAGTGDSPAYVQSASKCNTGSGNVVAFTSNVTSGNVIIVAYKSEDTNAVTGVADSLGTTFTQAANFDGSGSNDLWIYIGKTTSSGADTVTVTQPSKSYPCTNINEFSGISGTFVSNVNTNGNSSTSTSWSQTVSASPTLIYAMAASFNSSSVFTAGSGQTLTTQANGADAIAGEYQVISSNGTYTVGYSGTNPSGMEYIGIVVQ